MKDPSNKKDGKRLKKQRTDKDKYKTNSKMADISPITSVITLNAISLNS